MIPQSPVTLILLALAALIAVLEFLLILLTYENTRYFRSRRRTSRANGPLPRAELFLPCKGIDARFDATVESVLRQEYPHYRVTFVVESADDPAYGRLQSLLRLAPGTAGRVVVAGPAEECAQKVHNLLVATRSLLPDTEVLAFID